MMKRGREMAATDRGTSEYVFRRSLNLSNITVTVYVELDPADADDLSECGLEAGAEGSVRFTRPLSVLSAVPVPLAPPRVCGRWRRHRCRPGLFGIGRAVVVQTFFQHSIE